MGTAREPTDRIGARKDADEVKERKERYDPFSALLDVA